MTALAVAEEMRAWLGYRRLRTLLDLQITRDLAGDSQLSDADYDVLSTVSERARAPPAAGRAGRRRSGGRSAGSPTTSAGWSSAGWSSGRTAPTTAAGRPSCSPTPAGPRSRRPPCTTSPRSASTSSTCSPRPSWTRSRRSARRSWRTSDEVTAPTPAPALAALARSLGAVHRAVALRRSRHRRRRRSDLHPTPIEGPQALPRHLGHRRWPPRGGRDARGRAPPRGARGDRLVRVDHPRRARGAHLHRRRRARAARDGLPRSGSTATSPAPGSRPANTPSSAGSGRDDAGVLDENRGVDDGLVRADRRAAASTRCAASACADPRILRVRRFHPYFATWRTRTR